jgi:hypothetical protein
MIVAVVLAGLATSDGVRAQAPSPTPGERVLVTPGEGGATTRFRFTGSGFAPGRTVSIRLTPPDGVERRFMADDGAEVVWLVGPDGGFALDLSPAQRFPGAPAGHWRALFCAFAAPTCQLIDFDVLP